MGNRECKPKRLVSQLVSEMQRRGITLKYTDESSAIEYLSNTNNYLRTAAYRKNYQKYQQGPNKGKYIDLDFSYLVEMSVIDMNYRFLIQKMCSDIEHSICVQLIKDIENDSDTDGYDLVQNYLEVNRAQIKHIENTIASPHTKDLLIKYFHTRKEEDGKVRIVGYDECPVWVLMELISFGSIISFYLNYYENRSAPYIPKRILNLVRSLRNAAAHNNCILFNLKPQTSVPPREITTFVQDIGGVTRSQRQRKLSSRAVLEFVSLVYVYDKIVTGKVKKHRFRELDYLVNIRMKEKAGFFKSNEMIVSTYRFIRHITNVMVNK